MFPGCLYVRSTYFVVQWVYCENVPGTGLPVLHAFRIRYGYPHRYQLKRFDLVSGG